MKKVIVALAVMAMAGSVMADIYANPIVGYGIYGNGDNGGIVDNVNGTQIIMQIIDGGGDGLDYEGAGLVFADGVSVSGNDSLIGVLYSAATGGGDYADYGALFSGSIGGNGVAWSADTYVRISGINAGDWVWEGSVSFANGDYSDPKTLPEVVAVDNYLAQFADGSVTVIPEPATIGLMGIAGLGMFLARRKASR